MSLKNFYLIFLYLISFCFLIFETQAKIQKQNFLLKHPFSNLPLIHNHWVQKWITFFEENDPHRFRTWLERSYCYSPIMRRIFKDEGIPEDLIYMSMIESGFLSTAVSSAKAVGYWQFIHRTAKRFGLLKNNWIDERKDFEKSTYAASKYLKLLHSKFGDWYLAAAAYNMGENKLERLIKKYQTNDFWNLAKKYDFPYETAHYVPQLIAAITIAKAPVLYGFNHLHPKRPYKYEIFYLPGGTNLRILAKYIEQPYKKLKQLNPELLKDYIPKELENWRVRIPIGSATQVSQFIKKHSM